MTEQRSRQCLRSDGARKYVYLTKRDAKQALKRVPGTADTGWNRAYHCHDCGYYHIGGTGG